MAVDLEKFIKHLRAHADSKAPGHGKCGLFVRKALQAGGANFHGVYPPQGKLFGPALEMLGFHEITVENPDTFRFMPGDVMVMEPYVGSTNPNTAIKSRGRTMPSIATKRIVAAILFTVSAAAAAMAGDKPPRVLSVPVLGLRLPLAGINLEEFPKELRVKCLQIEDEYRTSRVWVFGRAKDAAKTYYVLTGYTKRLHPEPDQTLYEYWDDGVVFSVRGDQCGGDGAAETFDTHDPNADNDGNVPGPIVRELARDLAARAVRAFGGPDRLRAEIKNQRIDFNALPPDLQAAFKPYFELVK